MGTILRHQKAIKQKNFSNKDIKEENIFLTSAEKKQLGEMNADSNMR